VFHDFSGVLTFTPDTNVGLKANTTYQVDFFSDAANGVGFADAAGNTMDAYSFRFSTGSNIDSNISLGIQSITASDLQPLPGEEIQVEVTATGVGQLEYRFNFDGTFSDWATSNTASHIYSQPGRASVIVQVRDDSQIPCRF